MDLSKLAIAVEPTCKGATSFRASINGRPISNPTISTSAADVPAGKAVLQLTNLDLTNYQADGALICLYPKGQCDTLEALCEAPTGAPPGTCQASLFNFADTCCPLSTVGGMSQKQTEQQQQQQQQQQASPSPARKPSTSTTRQPSPKSVARTASAPKPAGPCPVCISLATSLNDLSQGICDDLASHLNFHWLSDASPVNTQADFKCSETAPSRVTACAHVSSPADATALATSAEDPYQIRLLMESLHLGCASEDRAGSESTYRIAYGADADTDATACRPQFQLPQTCAPPVEPGQPGGDGGFPYHDCDRNLGSTRFALLPFASVQPAPQPGDDSGVVAYCFTAYASLFPRDPESVCGSADVLDKVEFFVEPSLQGALVGVSAGGRRATPAWDAESGVLSIKELGWSAPFIKAQAPRLCLELQGATLGEFCRGGSCAYSPFSGADECCPLGRAFLPSAAERAGAAVTGVAAAAQGAAK